MHAWIVFLHATSVVVFLLAHGASHSVSLRIPHERKPERLRALLDLSTSGYGVMFGALGLVFVFGVAAGFSGQWWGAGWIWAALALSLVISVAMFMLAQRNYYPLRAALGMPVAGGAKAEQAAPPASDDAIAALAAAARPLPNIIFGVGGLIILVWLMLFKPF
jgi:hypothetical protein